MLYVNLHQIASHAGGHDPAQITWSGSGRCVVVRYAVAQTIGSIVDSLHLDSNGSAWRSRCTERHGSATAGYIHRRKVQ